MEVPDRYREMSEARNPYGDGHAAARIANTMLMADGVIDRPLISVPDFVEGGSE